MIIKNYKEHKQKFDNFMQNYNTFIKNLQSDITHNEIENVDIVKTDNTIPYRVIEKFTIIELYKMLSEDIMNVFRYLELYIPSEYIRVSLCSSYEESIINSLFVSTEYYIKTAQENPSYRFKWFYKFSNSETIKFADYGISILFKYIKYVKYILDFHEKFFKKIANIKITLQELYQELYFEILVRHVFNYRQQFEILIIPLRDNYSRDDIDEILFDFYSSVYMKHIFSNIDKYVININNTN